MEKTKDINSVLKLIKRITFDWLLLFGIYVPFALVIVESLNHGRWELSSRWSLSTVGWKKGHLWVLIFYSIFVASYVLYQVFLFIKLSGRKQQKARKQGVALLALLVCICVSLIAAIVFADVAKTKGPMYIMIGLLGLFLTLAIFVIVLYIKEKSKATGRFENKQFELVKWIAIIGAAIFLTGVCIPVDDSIKDTGIQSFRDMLHCRFSQAGMGILVIAVVIMAIIYCRDVKDVKSKIMILLPLVFLIGFGAFGLFIWWVAAFFEIWLSFMGMVYIHYLTVNYEIADRCSTLTLSPVIETTA